MGKIFICFSAKYKELQDKLAHETNIFSLLPLLCIFIGDPESLVHAYWEGHDLVATINTKEDIYVIEVSFQNLVVSEL